MMLFSTCFNIGFDSLQSLNPHYWWSLAQQRNPTQLTHRVTGPYKHNNKLHVYIILEQVDPNMAAKQQRIYPSY